MLLGALRGMAVAGTQPGPADGLAQPVARHLRPAGPGQRRLLPLPARDAARSPGRRQDTPPRCCSATGRGACWRRRTACCSERPRVPPTGRPRRRSKPATCCSCTPTDWSRGDGQPAAERGRGEAARPSELLDLAPRFARGPHRAGLRTDGRRGVRRDRARGRRLRAGRQGRHLTPDVAARATRRCCHGRRLRIAVTGRSRPRAACRPSAFNEPLGRASLISSRRSSIFG